MLDNFIAEYKTKAATDANKGVNYSLKGKPVMRIGTGDDLENYPSVKIIFKNKNDDISVIDNYSENEAEDLKTQARLHLTGCDANKCVICSTFQSGNYVTVLDGRHQICSMNIAGFAWVNPSEADMAVIKRLLKIRCEK